MNKILLVYEDYADLMAVESTLKKVGFDVIGLTSEYSVAEQVLAFNPDLVVGCGNSAKVTSVGVGKRLKEMSRWPGKSILIFPPQAKPTPEDLMRIRVDMLLETPVAPLRLVQVIGKLLNMDESLLLERLNKASHLEPSGSSSGLGMAPGAKAHTQSESIYIKGKVPSSEEEGTAISGGSEESSDESESARSSEVGFRFGDRMTSSEAMSEAESAGTESEFEDVDLKSLENEILGKDISSNEAESRAVTGDTQEEEELKSIGARAQQEVLEAELKFQEKRDKYAKFATEVKVSPQSTITRVEARRRQKEIKKQFDVKSGEDLDKLRRQFTKALFKK